MKVILKCKWFVIVAWVALLVGLAITSPDMGKLIREKGQITLPDYASSSMATEILKEHEPESDTDTFLSILVLHDEEGIDEEEATSIINDLKDSKDELGITSITSFLDGEEVKNQTLSEDGKTSMILIESGLGDREVSEVKDDLNKHLDSTDMEHYLTGDMFINEDLIVSAENGVKKSEALTIIFIFTVLIIVFRSVVTPLIPLITVGMAYISSYAIVGFLVDNFNFPLSSFTQQFIMAILFGIGTDYCILLFSRFKEEIPQSETIDEAIIKTYKTAGTTVFYSAIAVLIGFAAIGFSDFSVYKSSTGVAIGVAMLILALLTIIPVLMSLLGQKLFWPSKKVKGHSENKLWGAMGTFSLRNPFLSLLFVAIIVVPILVLRTGDLSFNSLEEIGDKYDSVKGFNLIEEGFGAGEAMPMQVVMESTKTLDNQEDLAAIEKVSSDLVNLDGVAKVRSVTRPTGEVIDDLYISDQVGQVGEGINEGVDGLDQISEGLTQANTSLGESGPQLDQSIAGVNQLIDGTKEIQSGVGQLQDGLAQIETGIDLGANGADELANGISTAKDGLAQIQSNMGTFSEGYQSVEDSIGQMSEQYSQVASSLEGLSSNIDSLLVNHPELAGDVDYLTIKGTIEGSEGNPGVVSAMGQLNQGLSQAMLGLSDLNNNFDALVSAQASLVDGLEQLESGANELQSGLEQAASGQSQVISNIPSLEEGVGQIADGQEQIKVGFETLSSQLGLFNDGLGQSVDGLNQISEGLGTASDYLSDVSDAKTGFYIPSEVIASEEFKPALDMYMTEDRYVTTLDVVLEDNPYSSEAIALTDEVRETVEKSLKGTSLENVDFELGGLTATSSDMSKVSDADYSRTVLFMLIGVAVVLVILLRSIIMPLYIIISLVICFFTALGINELIFVNMLGYDGVSWTMPFFGFVAFMSLGVDYSIFLMHRFNENRHLPVNEAILQAMKSMGGVIFSAVIILSGTFAAMMPSGVLSLMQMATIIIAGLILYSLVFLPFFIPVMVRLFGNYNWFPFKREEQ